MLTLFLTIFLIFLIILSTTLKNRRIKKYAPGPLALPFIGNARQLQKLGRKLGGPHMALLELSRIYDSPVISLRLGKNNTIVVTGSEAIEKVLTREEFDGRPWNYFVKLRNMGMKKGITCNDGKDWKNIRTWFVKSLTAVGFAKKEMSGLIIDQLKETLENFKNGGVVQMKPHTVPIVINVLWIFVSGKPFAENRLQYFVDLMERRARIFDMSGGLLAAYPWIRFIAPEYSGYNVLVALNNELKSILRETIDEHVKNYDPGNENDLIDMFLKEMYTGRGPEAGFDVDQLIIVLLDVLLAGLNITSKTLDFLFLNMLLNQKSQELLHEEIDKVIGSERLPNLNDRAMMPYLEAVLLESQRLVPVVPVIGPRRVLRDTELMGFHVAKNTSVLMNIYSITRDQSLYPEPHAFKPERFLKNGLFQNDDNLIFFGKGHRQCPGISLAKSSIFFIFTGIMQKYKLVQVPGEETAKLSILPGMTLTPKDYKLLLLPRF